MVNTKLAQISGISWKLTHKFNINVAKIFYYSFVYSRLSFGITAWGGILMTYNCSRLYSLVRRIILNLFAWHYPKLTYEEICTKLCFLTPTDIYKLDLMVLFYNIQFSQTHRHMAMLEFEALDSKYNLRNQSDFRVPFPRVNTLKTHFEYRMPQIWNTIPTHIRSQTNVIKFKALYKAHLLNSKNIS